MVDVGDDGDVAEVFDHDDATGWGLRAANYT
jgi:hypothetical protein